LIQCLSETVGKDTLQQAALQAATRAHTIAYGQLVTLSL